MYIKSGIRNLVELVLSILDFAGSIIEFSTENMVVFMDQLWEFT